MDFISFPCLLKLRVKFSGAQQPLNISLFTRKKIRFLNQKNATDCEVMDETDDLFQSTFNLKRPILTPAIPS